MKSYFLSLCLCCLTTVLFSQLKNHGGTLKIDAGGTLNVDGDFTNLSGSTLTNEGTITATGGITNQATATLQGNGQYMLSGDWFNAGVFAAGMSTVIFEGASNSAITAGGDAFYQIEIDKTAADLTLADEVVIEDLLEFVSMNNKFILSGNDLRLGSAADILGFDETNYIITDDIGVLRKSALGAIPYTFPVGFDAVSYNPVTLTQNGTADELGVRCLEHHYVAGSSGAQFSSETVDASWEITEAVPGDNLLDISVQWTASDELAFNRSDCMLGLWTGSKWDYGIIPGAAASGTGPFWQERLGIAGVGIIGVRSGSALPVELLFFNAEAVGDMAALTWATASEINADRFEVEHSADGFSFVKIGTVEAAGLSTTEQHYDFLHTNPVDGVNYYRLRQVDFDGSFEYSRVEVVNFHQLGDSGNLTLYPNPTTDVLHIEFEVAEDYFLRVFDENGSLVHSGENITTLDVSEWPAGVYALWAASKGREIVRKFVVGR